MMVLNENFWPFSRFACRIWTTLDIWLCTASIYNLVAISVDRYVAIIKPLEYSALITRRRTHLIIGAVWLLSFIICVPKLFDLGQSKTNISHKSICACEITESNILFRLYSATGSFYLPTFIIIFIYVRIYDAARKALRAICGHYSNTTNKPALPKSISDEAPNQTKGSQGSEEKSTVTREDSASPKRTQRRLQRDLSRDIHRDKYDIKRHDPLLVSIRRLRFARKDSSNKSIESVHTSSVKRHPLQHANSVPAYDGDDMQHMIESNTTETTVDGAQNSTNKNDMPHHTLNPVEEQNEDITDDSLSQVPRMVKAPIETPKPQQLARQHTHHTCPTITPEMIDRFNTLNRNAFCSKRQDPLKQSLRRLRQRTASDTDTSFRVSFETIEQFSVQYTDKIGTEAIKATDAKRGSNSSNTSNRITKFIEKTKNKLSGGTTYYKRMSLEIRAARTVAIVTGCFIFCWIGFSILYVLHDTPFCRNRICNSNTLFVVFVWLGYLNSALNPVIYTIFNRDFRNNIYRLLACGKWGPRRQRQTQRAESSNAIHSEQSSQSLMGMNRFN